MKEELTPDSLVRITGHKDLQYGYVVKAGEKKVLVSAFDAEEPWETRKIACGRDQLTPIPPVCLTGDDLRRLIRYEVSFQELTEAMGPVDNYHIDGDYQTTLEDLETALKNLREKKADWFDFSTDWFSHIWWDETLTAALGLSEEETEEETEESGHPDLLPLTEAEMLLDLFDTLGEYVDEDMLLNSDDFQKEFPFDDLLRKITYFREDRDRPLAEKRFSDEDKRAFIVRYDEKNFQKLNEDYQALWRRFLEELCAQEDLTALKIKAYACYGGSDACPCDWYASRDCLLKYFEKTGDKFAANTLGYIYYYGRCSQGQPDYEKAYYYFSIGAFHLVYESQYKLADMFAHGYGVPKMPEAAYNLYREVYDDNLKRFCKGEFECKFADAALRMSNACKMNLVPYGRDRDYYYCLQADYAIRQRIPYDYYGDNAVYRGIQEAMAKAKEEYHHTVKAVSTVRCENMSALLEPEESFGRCRRARVKEKKGGSLVLTVSAVCRPGEWPGEKEQILLTVPEADYCGLQDRVRYELTHVDFCEIVNGTDTFLYHTIKWNRKGKYWEFLHDGEITARIRAEEVIWRAPAKKKGEKTILRFAGIRFAENGRVYDYLCEDETIQAGDRVIVQGYDGETEVTVCRVYTSSDDETGLPKDRYKKILRRAEP